MVIADFTNVLMKRSSTHVQLLLKLLAIFGPLVVGICAGWRIGSPPIPELKLIPSDEDPKHWLDTCYPDSTTTGIAIATGGILAAILGDVLAPRISIATGMPEALAGTLILTVATFLIVFLWSRRMHTLACAKIREKLNEEGIPVCMRCGYCLHGVERRCPECNEPFDVPMRDDNSEEGQ